MKQQQSFRRCFYFTNTFIANTGEVYKVEPFQLPPPRDIAALFKDKAPHGEKGDGSPSTEATARVLRQRSASPFRERSPRRSSFNGTLRTRGRRKLAERASGSAGSGGSGGERANGSDYGVRRPSVDSFQDDMVDVSSFSLFKYLRVEMFGVQDNPSVGDAAPKQIGNFLSVPFSLESFLRLGVTLCLDVFLYVLTFMPVRVVYALTMLLLESISAAGCLAAGRLSSRARYFHRTHAFDIMRGLILVMGCAALSVLDMSRVYHYIRGQSMIKLYVLSAMLDIFDKLMCSFGLDAFDALYWNTRKLVHPRSLAGSFFVVSAYVMLHATVLFLHAATFTVATNSNDQALLTLLISNNFAEIKSFVFKKFARSNLMQLASSDAVERFKLTMFIVSNVIVSLTQDPLEQVGRSFVQVFVLTMGGEVLADWTKHCFITKFNDIDASVYEEFAAVVRLDVVHSKKENVILDHTFAVTRRLGLAQIPMACVVLRYLSIALVSFLGRWRTPFGLSRRAFIAFAVVVTFLVLLVIKVLLGVALFFQCAKANNETMNRLRKRSDSIVERESMARLAEISRFTVNLGKVW